MEWKLDTGKCLKANEAHSCKMKLIAYCVQIEMDFQIQ